MAGILAGWGNENTSGAGILLVLFLLVLCKLEKRKWKPWCITGLLGQVTGYLFLILAPGNFSRLESTSESESLLIKYSGRLSWSLQLIEAHLKLLLLLSMVVFVILCFYHQSKKQIYIAAVVFISALACHFAMLLSPEYPERALMGTVVFLLIELLYSVSGILDAGAAQGKLFVWIAVSCMTMFFCFSFLSAGMDIAHTYRSINRRTESILEQKAAGETDIITYQILPESSHNAGYGLADISVSENYWLNKAVAKYFGVETIVTYVE